jgi:ParB family chromosome partitioning protein
MKNTMNTPVAIPVSKLHPFEGHPYKVLDNDEMNTLIESIQMQGILSPLIVRPKENTTDEYEVVSGHRRLHAAVKAGLETVPAFIYALDRDAAAIAVVDSNLHREHILPSEKAFAYKMKLDAMSRQGYRSDLTSDQVGRKLETAEIIAQQSDDSKSQVRRYIRLTYLIPELLDWMDEGKIALSVGVELSFLSDEAQYGVLEECELYDCTPSYSQAFHMKNLYNDGNLSRYEISKMLSQEKPNQRETLKIPMDKLRDRLPQNLSMQQQEDFILKAVDYYKKYLQRQRDQAR